MDLNVPLTDEQRLEIDKIVETASVNRNAAIAIWLEKAENRRKTAANLGFPASEMDDALMGKRMHLQALPESAKKAASSGLTQIWEQVSKTVKNVKKKKFRLF